MSDVKFIYASDQLGLIAVDSALPWHIPEDLAQFKQKTLHCNVLMGRKTYDSLPPSFRPLPNRTSYIATRGTMPAPYRCHLVDNAVEFIKKFNKPIWVIGGAELFNQLEEFCTEVHHTEVYASIDSPDATVYRGNHHSWQVTSDSGVLTSKAQLPYRVRVYNRQFVIKEVL